MQRPPAVRTLAIAGLLSAAVLTPVARADAQDGPQVPVIVRSTESASTLHHQVEAFGGHVERDLGIIRGVEATVPAGAIAELRSAPGVVEVTPDGKVKLLSDDYRADHDLGSLFKTAQGVHADAVRGRNDSQGRRITGKGVGVALIDSGVTPVPGLDDDNLVNGPDLSFDSQSDSTRYLDAYGHGTHMAGIISGRDAAVVSGKENDPRNFVGIAPDANIINMKVAAADGSTDVSQVIAAIDWVVQHKDDPSMNIRVLNLSFGTPAQQTYLLDPLAYAAEVAWRKGIVVVVSAGNEGNSSNGLDNPAMDPFVISVGSEDHNGTDKEDDDKVSSFSSQGDALRSPDVIAPGRSIASLRDPGSFLDRTYPGAIDGPLGADGLGRYFRGSGTSQAAAVVSGSVALLLQQRPTLTPDQVKRLLTSTADPVKNTSTLLQGAGTINVNDASNAKVPTLGVTQTFAYATGLGSLELARGGVHVVDPTDGTVLSGEQDIFGQAWDGRSWADAAWNGRSWAGGTWNGSTWAGTDWAGRSWAAVTWDGRSWAGRSWAGRSWADLVWDGRSWAGRSWADSAWAGRSWAGRSWAAEIYGPDPGAAI
jgi:serine protease AprX